MFDFLKGKKTYLVALAAAILAGLEAYGISIPAYVYTGLAALGLGTVRAGIAKKGK